MTKKMYDNLQEKYKNSVLQIYIYIYIYIYIFKVVYYDVNQMLYLLNNKKELLICEFFYVSYLQLNSVALH